MIHIFGCGFVGRGHRLDVGIVPRAWGVMFIEVPKGFLTIGVDFAFKVAPYAAKFGMSSLESVHPDVIVFMDFAGYCPA